MKNQAQVVIIGGGIFGVSVAYHLAKMECTDVVLLEKGELTSGTTFHSVGLVSQFRTSPSLMKIMNYTIGLFNRLQEEVGDALGWHTVGSLRLASSPERLKGLQREVSRAKAIGIRAEIVSPAEVLDIAPYLSRENLHGAVWVPDDGHIDPSSITYELARQARKLGVEVTTGVRVTDIGLSPKGQITRVMTDRGEIQTECVVNAAGEWAPRISEMIGVHLPMVPLMHQYLTTKPIPGHELPKNTPVVRDPDKLFYCREDAGAFLIGAFESNPKAWSADGVPWGFTQELLSPEWELFEPILEMAMERIPILSEVEAVELVNGPDAFTPDGHYALGPVPGRRGYYVAAGGSINGIAGAGGVGKIIAEWIVEGAPSIDMHEMNVRRFGSHWKNLDYLTEHCREVYRYYYHIRFPNDENEWGRPARTSPFYEKLMALGAVFGEKNGWERANYYTPGQPGRTAGADQRGWGKPEFFDRVAEEVHTAREKAALIDMTSFGKIDVLGPGASAFLQYMAAGNVDKPVGSIVYTQFLNERGGIESDVTVTRMAENHFRVISGTSFVSNDLGWLTLHLPDDGSVRLEDVTEKWACLALCGPLSRQVLADATTSEVGNDAFPYMTAREITIADSKVWAQRISYTGELGWELYIPWDAGAEVFDKLLSAGEAHGLKPMGYKALDSMRIEKGFLYWSGDITPEDNPLEAGLAFGIDFSKNFIGKAVLSKIQSAGLQKKLCAIILDADFKLFGGESLYRQDRLVGRIRTAAYGHNIAKDVALAYLPIDATTPGTQILVELMGERLPALVAALPLVTASGDGIRG